MTRSDLMKLTKEASELDIEICKRWIVAYYRKMNINKNQVPAFEYVTFT